MDLRPFRPSRMLKGCSAESGEVEKEEHCLRVGILGCGPISQFAHLESAQKARNVVLRAVCDADGSLAAALAPSMTLSGFTSTTTKC